MGVGIPTPKPLPNESSSQRIIFQAELNEVLLVL